MRNIVILGSTGSIGKSSLEVIAANPKKLRVCALAGGHNAPLLAEQALKYKPKYVAIADKTCYGPLKRALSGHNIQVEAGEEAVIAAAGHEKADTVIAAIVGVAGLPSVMHAIEAKKRICFANKETLVVAGSLVMSAVKKNKVELLPVDSEHSAIFQCLRGNNKRLLKKIIITASGGPFRTFSKEQIAVVGPEQALKHPNWSMGGKITIDSSTLMNKALEVIEAHWLFNVGLDKIEIVIHPQSIIHSLVEFVDGSVLAQLGWPNMKLPIQYALSCPSRFKPVLPSLDLCKVKEITFEKPDTDKFLCLKYGLEAAREGGSMPCVLNAANEAAVEAFLNKKIGFNSIAKIVKSALTRFENKPNATLAELLELDKEVKKYAKNLISEGKI